MANNNFFLGIDIGSTASKCVIVDGEGNVIAHEKKDSGAGTPAPRETVDAALASCNITEDDLSGICATGYGRNLVKATNEAARQVSELSCHARGAASLFTDVKTVIDIGGQDAKVLRIDDKGNLENFVMNDKCAAGTGRFLDVMAGVFGCKVSDLSKLDEQSTETTSISSTCTVFAESEVISKLSAGNPIPNIVAGIDESVVSRTAGLARRVGIVPKVAMVGGVALNDSLRRRLEKEIGYPIITSSFAQFNGAFGAALIARDKYAAGSRKVAEKSSVS